MAPGPEEALVVGSGIPNSPNELIAMQESKSERPEKPERQQSAKVKQVLELMDKLETSADDDQQIALAILRQLERFHDGVVEEMREDEEAKHSQIAAWAVDADRLMHCRIFLESIDL
jgi:predicted metal-dependent HD superfamily phosphohydrolase